MNVLQRDRRTERQEDRVDIAKCPAVGWDAGDERDKVRSQPWMTVEEILL